MVPDVDTFLRENGCAGLQIEPVSSSTDIMCHLITSGQSTVTTVSSVNMYLIMKPGIQVSSDFLGFFFFCVIL